MEKLKIQGSANHPNLARESNNQSSLGKLIKNYKTLSIKVSEGTGGWILFFNTLKRAFKSKKCTGKPTSLKLH